MGLFNAYGLIAVVIILIPNIICAIKYKDAFENRNIPRAVLVLEQLGRYGCMVFSVLNIPYTYFGFWFGGALFVYLIAGGICLVFYCLGWVLFFARGGGMEVWLSVTPTVFFVFCGVMLLSVPLIVSALLFGIAHIFISVRNKN